ncbi:MAG: GTPase ObgE [Christensenellaceae bacterium]|jgi:GTP-binding protein|nr:GTPase ObgE [Christensenellaceae bacterium]
MFIDKVQIVIRAGNGGDGHKSFYRDTLNMTGGPDGGDGGRGGNVVAIGDQNIDNLVGFHFSQKFNAENGENGGRGKKHGKNGKDLVIRVPLGTKIIKETGEIVADITRHEQTEVLLKGGAGGLGNMHFATSTKQTPNFSQTGEITKPYNITLELSTIADVGLIGFPNVGKSTLLSVITRANPKIGNYHFTTVFPNIGIANVFGENIVIADIPGLIEGASAGAGLGIDFLKHISRTRLLIHIVDIAETEGRNALDDYKIINNELKGFGSALDKKPQIIALNKCDALAGDKTKIKDFKKAVKNKKIFEISAFGHSGVKELLEEVYKELKKIPKIEATTETTALEDYVDKSAFEVVKNLNGFEVKGAFIDNIVRGVVLEDTESRMYFHKKLEEAGVFKALKKAGLESGDTVKIKNQEFTWEE